MVNLMLKTSLFPLRSANRRVRIVCSNYNFYLFSSMNGILVLLTGKLVEYDEPMNLMKKEGSLFKQLVKEYWSHFHSAESY